MKKKFEFEEYRRLLSYMKPYRRSFVFACVCMLLVSATSGGAALMTQPLLDDIFIKKNKELLALITGGIILLYFIRGIARYYSSILMKQIGHQTARDIRDRLYTHIQKLSLSFFQRHTTGKLASRIVNDINVIQDSISVVVYNFFREGFTVLALLGVLFYRDAKLALIAILVLPFSAILIARLSRLIRHVAHRMMEGMADLTSLMHETFSGYRVVQAFGMQDYESKRFEKENEDYYQLSMKTVRIYEMSSPIMEFIGAFGVAAIVWYGGIQVIEEKTTVGNFFSFLTALFMLFNPLSRLSQVFNRIQHTMAAAARVFEILDQKPEIVNSENAKPVEPLEASIKLANVSFKYNIEPVLKNIDLEVKAGTMLAIVGMSGAGKSTLVDLIARFYDPVEGSIYFDETDIRFATLESVRNQIGIVTQEVFLFNDTVRSNIAYGKEDTPLDTVVHAAKMAYAHDFIMQMPEGYNTLLGERGSRLSGGQRQRISIARAIMKNPRILILDEATSALDTQSEIEVQKALANLISNRTTFVIAHRLSTILHADRIIVLDKGKIVEQGDHETLLKLNGTYKRLYELQFSNATPIIQ